MKNLVARELPADVTARLPVQRCGNGLVEFDCDIVAEEVPVALEYNGISHVVMMASPHNLEDFALGYSLTEGIVESISEISELETAKTPDGIVISIRILGGCFARLKQTRRTMAGRTGCGLCGIETLHQVRRSSAPVGSMEPMSISSFQAGLSNLRDFQPMHVTTGATHAAAWILRNGDIACVREDVGRHNALDKLVGALALEGGQFATGAVLLTSRASYEMVQKSALVGIGIIAAISAPTALAVRLAHELNVTLVGFVRPGKQVVYANGYRLI